MNIAIATDFYSPWIGGPATFIENFACYLAEEDHQITVLAPSPSGPSSIDQDGPLTTWRLPTLPVPFGYQLRVAVRPTKIREALRAIRPDVVQVHHPFPLCLSVMRAARELGIPVVAVNHTIPECSFYGLRDLPGIYPFSVGAFRRYLVWFLRQADAISTPTNTAARLLRGMALQRPVTVISNGIDTGRFQPGSQKAARAQLGLPDRPTMLYTGRLDAEKDIPTWIRAGALLLQEVDAHLVIGGQGAARPELERIVRQLGIGNHVTLPGYLPAAHLPTLYQAADVYCMTSAVELQSITTLEALASGLPVVAANARALPELVRDGHNGFLATPGDPASFARGLLAILSSPRLAVQMGAAGREMAEEHSLKQVAQRHLELLRGTLEARSRGTRDAAPV